MPQPLTMTPSYELADCPACGTHESDEIADRNAILEEMEVLWEFHARRIRPETPPTRLADRVAFSQSPPLRVVACRECGLVYRNPRERAWTLRDTYANEDVSPDVLAALHDTQLNTYREQAQRLTKVAEVTGDGLEIGSYVGAFLTAAAEDGWRFTGVDINETATSFARQRGHDVILGEIDDVPENRRYHAIAFWNCFDQLPDPRASAAAARVRLREGGVVAIRVPNGGFYQSVRRRLDGKTAPAARAMLAHNNLLGFPYRHGFTPDSLARLLERSRFEIIHEHGDALVPIADEWTRGWAALEERALKGVLRLLARSGMPASASPWFEIYARAV